MRYAHSPATITEAYHRPRFLLSGSARSVPFRLASSWLEVHLVRPSPSIMCHDLYTHSIPGAAATSAIIRVMLSHFGLRKTMLIKAGIDTAILGTAYLLLKERRKPSTTVVWYDKKYLTDPTFWSITLCVCFANFGYPTPLFYLPTFAKQKVPNLTELVNIPLYDVSVDRRTYSACYSFLPSPLPFSTYRQVSVVAALDSSRIELGPPMRCFSSS